MLLNIKGPFCITSKKLADHFFGSTVVWLGYILVALFGTPPLNINSRASYTVIWTFYILAIWIWWAIIYPFLAFVNVVTMTSVISLIAICASDYATLAGSFVKQFSFGHSIYIRTVSSEQFRGCQRCNFVLQCALNCLNLEWQLVHTGTFYAQIVQISTW